MRRLRRRHPLDMKWMDRALDLAERGRYTVSPNPMVGAVIVRDGRLLAEAFHERAGGPHAEAAALQRAGEAARGSDLYVTLEPCAHFGRTPPCSSAILASGLRRVAFAARDRNPAVAGRGLRLLEREGIAVVEAGEPWRGRAERQNEKFLFSVGRRTPFVLAKWAQSLDGKLAAAGGDGRWITGEEARRRALLLREEYDAVLVGAGTILADDPLLTRRLGVNRVTRHRRIVLDGRLRISEKARVFERPGESIVVTARSERHPKARRLSSRGVAVWSVSGAGGRVSVPRLLRRLGREGISSLLVEGGGETLWEFFRADRVDRAAVFVAPRILGGAAAPGSVAGRGFSLATTPRLRDMEIERVGEDLLITGRVRDDRQSAIGSDL